MAILKVVQKWLFWPLIILALWTQTSLDVTWDGIPFSSRLELLAILVLSTMILRLMFLKVFQVQGTTSGIAPKSLMAVRFTACVMAIAFVGLKWLHPIEQGFELCKKTLESELTCTFSTENWVNELDWSAKDGKYWRIGHFNTLAFNHYSSSVGPDERCLTHDVESLPPHCHRLDYRRRAAHPFEVTASIRPEHISNQKNLHLTYTGRVILEPFGPHNSITLPFTRSPQNATIPLDRLPWQEGFRLKYRNFQCTDPTMNDLQCQLSFLNPQSRERLEEPLAALIEIPPRGIGPSPANGEPTWPKQMSQVLSPQGLPAPLLPPRVLPAYNSVSAETIHFSAAVLKTDLTPIGSNAALTFWANILNTLLGLLFYGVCVLTLGMSGLIGLKSRWKVGGIGRRYLGIVSLGAIGMTALFYQSFGPASTKPYPLAIWGASLLTIMVLFLKFNHALPSRPKAFEMPVLDSIFSAPLLVMAIGLLFFSSVPPGDDPFLYVAGTDRFAYYSWAFTELIGRGTFPKDADIQGMLIFSKPFFLYSRAFFIYLFGDGTLYVKRLQNFLIYALPFFFLASTTIGILRCKLNQAFGDRQLAYAFFGVMGCLFAVMYVAQDLFRWSGLFAPGMSEWESWMLGLTGIILFFIPTISSQEQNNRRLMFWGVVLISCSLLMRTVNLANFAFLPFVYLITKPRYVLPNLFLTIKAFTCVGALILLHAVLVMSPESTDFVIQYLKWCIYGGSYETVHESTTIMELFDQARSIFFTTASVYLFAYFFVISAAVGFFQSHWTKSLVFLGIAAGVYYVGQVPLLKLAGYPRTLILPFYTMAIVSAILSLKLFTSPKPSS